MLKTILRTAALLSLALGSATVRAQAIDLPDIPACTAVLPGSVAVTDVPVTLDVRVLLDGVSQAQAAPMIDLARQAYAAMQIALSVSYETVSYSSNNALTLIAAAKSHYGGQRPGGIDIVYVLTNKDIVDASAGNALAGQADCIGGVAYADRAFAVGEFTPIAQTSLVLYALGTHFAAKTFAHEVGHLMGAHHHYANCAEAAVPGDAPCTLMFNFVDIQKLQFSTLNSLVVRGHAQLHATP